MKTASSDGLRRWPAIAALAALLLAAGAVAAIALTGGTSDRTTARSPSATTSSAKKQRTTSSSRSTSTQQKQTTQAQSTPSTSSTPAPASGGGGDPKALNDQGFALIGQGNNAAAVPLLQQSVQGFRDQGRTGEIDYAFALFNLATALRATGHPDQAIPLLEERLQRSDYKRAEVQPRARHRAPAGRTAGLERAGGQGQERQARRGRQQRPRQRRGRLEAARPATSSDRRSAPYTESLRVRRFKVARQRPMMGAHGRNPVLTPKVTEQKRGSAHGGTPSGKAAGAPVAAR